MSTYASIELLDFIPFRKVFAAFALDEKLFFSSWDIQRLRVSTVLRTGILLPPICPTNGSVHSYLLLSISVTPQMGTDIMRDFLSTFSSHGHAALPVEQGNMVFEVKVKSPEYWQVKFRFLINSGSQSLLEAFLINRQLTVKKDNVNEVINMPDRNGEVWRRIKHGVEEKEGLEKASRSVMDMTDLPCPHTEPHCYAAKSILGPMGVILDCVGLPRPIAALPSIELISGAMQQISNYQQFIKETRVQREMEGSDIHGVLISALAKVGISTNCYAK